MKTQKVEIDGAYIFAGFVSKLSDQLRYDITINTWLSLL